jgi:hypothetical protein
MGLRARISLPSGWIILMGAELIPNFPRLRRAGHPGFLGEVSEICALCATSRGLSPFESVVPRVRLGHVCWEWATERVSHEVNERAAKDQRQPTIVANWRKKARPIDGILAQPRTQC